MEGLEHLQSLRRATTVNTTEWSCDDKAKAYNSREGNLTGFDCPVCKNKGNIMVFENGYEYMQECECMEKRRSLSKMDIYLLNDRITEEQYTELLGLMG
ncbi:hypothetical protein [Anaerotignum neopropionicum]|uniref:hypothetical protein n=1 Tax=Anaerotignum neopropionicum TaxID=36847 RepID=UPI0012FD6FC4|nr:hypothetical protein [Anaerotignum neopropionicum]